MPIEVVLRDVQHHRSSWLKIIHAIELKARQLQHPDAWQRARVQMRAQGIEQRRANVAGDGDALAGALDQLARQRSHRSFPIGAGDR